MLTRRVLFMVAAMTGGVLLAATASPVTAQPQTEIAPDRGVYTVLGADGVAQRTAVAGSGVDVLGTRGATMTVVASPEQARSLRAGGFSLEAVGDFDAMLAERSGGQTRTSAIDEFPAGDEDYHTYAEMSAELEATARDHADLATMSSVGQSHEGRELHLIKISDNVATDEDEPEVLFTCNQHAREHLTTEMCLHIVQRFTDGYASDPAVKELVDSREILVVPSVNPDGSEYDISGGEYQGWRKNREGEATDLNRNWAYKWGCCGGSSGWPGSETYRGPSAFSAPETTALSDYVDSRVVDGTQQITAHIDFHTYSELVLWPYGYTEDGTAPGMTQDEARRFQDVGQQMAETNGYTPQQSSDLYVTDGSVNDWMWAQHKILSFTFEMYPSDGIGLDGFYPPDEVIPRETARNDEAVDILLEAAG
jgi:carboxypeptidase T